LLQLKFPNLQKDTNDKAVGNLILYAAFMIQSDTKKRELLKNPTKIEEIQEKKFIDRN